MLFTKHSMYIAIALVYVAVAFLWQITADQWTSWAIIFPKPSKVIDATLSNGSLLIAGIWQTVWQALLGMVLGALFAIFLAFILHPVPWLEKFLYPAMYAWQASPTIATTTLILLWLGFGTLSKIVLIVLVMFFPIYVSFSQSLRTVDTQWIALLRSYGASRWQLFYMVRWPWSLIGFFSGLRVANTYLISVVVTAQWLGGQDGLGNILLRSRKSYDYALMVSTIMICIGLSLLFVGVSVLIEDKFLKKYHLKKQ